MASVASTTPNSVTEDWAEAAPAAARTAKGIRDFFMQVSPRLNIGLRCEGVTKCRQFMLPPDPRANLLLGRLEVLHQRGLAFAKYLASGTGFRCTRTTETNGSVEGAQQGLFFFRMAKNQQEML